MLSKPMQQYHDHIAAGIGLRQMLKSARRAGETLRQYAGESHASGDVRWGDDRYWAFGQLQWPLILDCFLMAGALGEDHLHVEFGGGKDGRFIVWVSDGAVEPYDPPPAFDA